MSQEYLNPAQEKAKTRFSVSRESLLWCWGNVYSQAGQDGILREIFTRLGIAEGVFVEFGAWDGCFLANCRLLFERGWGGLFIEADKERFADLLRNYRDYPSIHCANELVSADNPLDEVVRRHTRFGAVDFVSIDVDGRDLDIALASNLSRLGVKVLLIEGGFNFDPRLATRLPAELVATGCGQPIAVMISELKSAGYEAVCFFQDLYLVRADLLADHFAGVRRDAVSLYLDAYNFGGDKLKELLATYRGSIQAERIEKAANLEYLRF